MFRYDFGEKGYRKVNDANQQVSPVKSAKQYAMEAELRVQLGSVYDRLHNFRVVKQLWQGSR